MKIMTAAEWLKVRHRTIYRESELTTLEEADAFARECVRAALEEACQKAWDIWARNPYDNREQTIKSITKEIRALMLEGKA